MGICEGNCINRELFPNLIENHETSHREMFDHLFFQTTTQQVLLAKRVLFFVMRILLLVKYSTAPSEYVIRQLIVHYIIEVYFGK